MDLTDVYKIFYPKATDYIFFFTACEIPSKTRPRFGDAKQVLASTKILREFRFLYRIKMD